MESVHTSLEPRTTAGTDIQDLTDELERIIADTGIRRGGLHGSAHPPFRASTRYRQLGRAGVAGTRTPTPATPYGRSIARVVDHLPEPSQRMTHTWGFYANAARGKRRKAGEQKAGARPTLAREDPVDTSTRQARLSWAKSAAPPPRIKYYARNRAPLSAAGLRELRSASSRC